jgi:hypothetical protein
MISWWYKREGSPGLPRAPSRNLVKVHLSHSTQRAINMLNKYLNKYGILCRDCKPCSIHWHVTCFSQNIRNWIEIRWPCVCVFKCVFLRRGFQNKPVSSRPSHNCRAQDSRRVSIPVTARTDRSVPGMTPAWSNASCAEMSREAGFNMRFIQKLCLKVSYWIGGYDGSKWYI